MEYNKTETEKIHVTEQMPSLLICDEKIKDSEKVADIFNTFFLSFNCWKFKFTSSREGRSNFFLTDSFPCKFNGIEIVSTSEAEIKCIILSIKSRNLSGYDEITSKILKACASLISRPLSHIYNHSLYTGVFLDSHKVSIVKPKPLFKKGDKTSMTNFRPISLLSTGEGYVQ